MRVAPEIFLDLKGKRVHPAPHVRDTRRQPHANAARYRDHRPSRTARARPSARPSTSRSTITRAPLASAISIRPAGDRPPRRPPQQASPRKPKSAKCPLAAKWTPDKRPLPEHSACPGAPRSNKRPTPEGYLRSEDGGYRQTRNAHIAGYVERLYAELNGAEAFANSCSILLYYCSCFSSGNVVQQTLVLHKITRISASFVLNFC